MPSVCLNLHTQVLTKSGWKFLLDLKLKDCVKCVAFEHTYNNQTPNNASKYWFPVNVLQTRNLYQAMWFRSKHFEFIYDECQPLTHKANNSYVIGYQELEDGTVEESKEQISIWDEELNPIIINSEENLEYFHSGEHKCYCDMIKFGWSTAGQLSSRKSYISVPLTKQGGKIRDHDDISDAKAVYLFA